MEAIAFAQQKEGALEQAQIRAQDLAAYVGSLETRIGEKDELVESINAEVANCFCWSINIQYRV